MHGRGRMQKLLVCGLRRADLRGADRLGHPKEDHDALTATAGRERLIRYPKATVDILPVVHDPDITCRSNREIGLHLQTAANVATGWRDLVAGLEAGRAGLSAHTAQLGNLTVRGGEIRNPHVVIAIDGRRKWGGQTATR